VLSGTILVTVLFLVLNVLYFFALPISFFEEGDPQLIRIGEAAASRLLGEGAAGLVTAFLALSILACLSAMVIAGPRVTFAMARDGVFFQAFGQLHPRWGTPARAILFQAGLATVYILTGTFEQIVTYCGFILFLFSALAVFSVFVLRRKDPGRPRPYRTFGYPILPAVFILFCVWVTVFTITARPVVSGLALLTQVAGLVAYPLLARKAAS
jgi:APA family basic amino acid/polyamine antiporter